MSNEDPESETSQRAGQKRAAEEPEDAVKAKQAKYMDQKRLLGASFGTRKAQKRQNNRDSNIIDTTNITDIKDSLIHSIVQNAKTVPDQRKIEAKQEELRPVPKYDATATTPEEAYKLDDIILPSEQGAMKNVVSAIKKAIDDERRMTFLPYRRSKYVNERIRRTCNVQEGQKISSSRLRILYYISLLIGLYLNRRSFEDREKVMKKLENPPSLLVESIIGRFSVANVVDNRNTDRMLTHIFVLGLHFDNFATDITTLQEDLALRPPQIASLYKEIGCVVGPITEGQRQALGLPKSEAKKLKRAVLKVPLVFPPPRRGGPSKR